MVRLSIETREVPAMHLTVVPDEMIFSAHETETRPIIANKKTIPDTQGIRAYLPEINSKFLIASFVLMIIWSKELTSLSKPVF
jgi:hypothetical protein